MNLEFVHWDYRLLQDAAEASKNYAALQKKQAPKPPEPSEALMGLYY